MVRDAAEILMNMCAHVYFRKTEEHSFRFANNDASHHSDYALNVSEVTPYSIRIVATDESFFHSYEVPMWSLSDSFFYQLWCTYKEEIKLTLTETGWKYFSEELEKRSAE
jgi:hypothetical protein